MTRHRKPRFVGFYFICHTLLFIAVHVLFALSVGIVPAEELPSGSYLEHISLNLWNHGIDIFLNDKINGISKTWKMVLLIHGIIDLIYLLFPGKDKEMQPEDGNSSLSVPENNNRSRIEGEPDSSLGSPDREKPPISTGKGWAFIVIGGALEIVWASGMKYSFIPSAIVLISLLISFDLLIRATRVLPIGTVYGVFTGIGTVGIVVMEAILEGSIQPLKVEIILLLLVFMILLKITGGRKERS